MSKFKKNAIKKGDLFTDKIPLPTICLIDADLLLYQVGSITFSNEGTNTSFKKKSLNLTDDGKIIPSKKNCQDMVDSILAEILLETNCKEYKLFTTGAGNFRYDIAKQEPYKGNRADLEKPVNFDVVMGILKSYGDIHIHCEGYEADDALVATRSDEDHSKYVIASRDKDLRTATGWHYRFKCGQRESSGIDFISAWSAWSFFLEQCLTGDSADNIYGCGSRDASYFGSAKIVEAQIEGEFKTKKAKAEAVKKLLADALLDNKFAEEINKEFGISQVMRKNGLTKNNANKAFEKCITIGDKLTVVLGLYKGKFGEGDYKSVFLENAQLLYMGQEVNDLPLFTYASIKPFINVTKDDDLQLEFNYIGE